MDQKGSENADVQPPLSKNALKRLKKKEERERTKVEWRAKKRAQRKASRLKKVLECKELGLPIPKRVKITNSNPPSGSVIFDFSFDGMMTERVYTWLWSRISYVLI